MDKFRSNMKGKAMQVSQLRTLSRREVRNALNVSRQCNDSLTRYYVIYKYKLLRTQPNLLSTVGVGLIILRLGRQLISEVNLAHPHYTNSTKN